MILAIDIGGTSIKLGLFADFETESLIAKESFPVSGGFESDLEVIASFCTKHAGSVDKITETIIAFPGVVDSAYNVIFVSNIKGWNGRNLKSQFSKSFAKSSFHLIHDVEAAALSDLDLVNLREFAFVIWGTGVGASIVKVVGGKYKIFRSELGFHKIRKEVLHGEKIEPGYLEYFTGGGAIEKRFSKSAKDLNESEWADVLDKLSDGLSNLVAMHFSEKLVFGGGVILNQLDKLPILEQKVNEKVIDSFTGKIKLSIAKHGADAGLYGCLYYLKLRKADKIWD